MLALFRRNAARVVPILLTISLLGGCEPRPDVKIGEPAPAFSTTDITGAPVSLSQLKGKIVLIYFWTNSCCGDSLKLVEPLYAANRHKGLAICAINVGDTKEMVTSYAQSNGLTFAMLTDEHSGIFRRYRAFGFPTIFIIDGQGVIREKILGHIETDKLEKVLQRQFDIRKQAAASYEKTHPR